MSNGTIIKILHPDAKAAEAFRAYTEVYSGMVKRQIQNSAYNISERKAVFEAKGITCGQINDLSFTVFSGECVVLQNVDYQVFDTLLAFLCGETSSKSGKVLINNREVVPKAGGEIAVIQELPTKTMLFNEMSYIDNLCFLLDRHIRQVWRNAGIREGVRREFSGILGEEVFDTRVDRLTEKQKYELVYMRIALQRPEIVFCVQPFRRADVELRMHIWGLMKMLLDKGIAIVILAVNLADSLSLADKLIRIKKDMPAEVYTRDEFPDMSMNVPWLDFYKGNDKRV